MFVLSAAVYNVGNLYFEFKFKYCDPNGLDAMQLIENEFPNTNVCSVNPDVFYASATIPFINNPSIIIFC